MGISKAFFPCARVFTSPHGLRLLLPFLDLVVVNQPNRKYTKMTSFEAKKAAAIYCAAGRIFVGIHSTTRMLLKQFRIVTPQGFSVTRVKDRVSAVLTPLQRFACTRKKTTF